MILLCNGPTSDKRIQSKYFTNKNILLIFKYLFFEVGLIFMSLSLNSHTDFLVFNVEIL